MSGNLTISTLPDERFTSSPTGFGTTPTGQRPPTGGTAQKFLIALESGDGAIALEASLGDIALENAP